MTSQSVDFFQYALSFLAAACVLVAIFCREKIYKMLPEAPFKSKVATKSYDVGSDVHDGGKSTVVSKSCSCEVKFKLFTTKTKKDILDLLEDLEFTGGSACVTDHTYEFE